MIWCRIKHFVIETVEMKENKRLGVKGFEWASWGIGGIGCYNTKCLIRKGLNWAVRVADGRGVHTSVELCLVQYNVFVAISRNSYVVCFNVRVQSGVFVKSWYCFDRIKVEKFVVIQKWNFDDKRKCIVYNNCCCTCMIDVAVNCVTRFQVRLRNKFN